MNQHVDEKVAAPYIAMSVSWLRQSRMKKDGPPFIKIGRSVRYRLSDLDAWLEKHRVEMAGAAA